MFWPVDFLFFHASLIEILLATKTAFQSFPASLALFKKTFFSLTFNGIIFFSNESSFVSIRFLCLENLENLKRLSPFASLSMCLSLHLPLSMCLFKMALYFRFLCLWHTDCRTNYFDSSLMGTHKLLFDFIWIIAMIVIRVSVALFTTLKFKVWSLNDKKVRQNLRATAKDIWGIYLQQYVLQHNDHTANNSGLNVKRGFWVEKVWHSKVDSIW